VNKVFKRFERFREFCGPVDPKVASAIRPGTLRAIFGINRIKNAIHCTDLDTDGAFESNYMFNVL
jgi:nucleoside-diphosphate kinase